MDVMNSDVPLNDCMYIEGDFQMYIHTHIYIYIALQNSGENSINMKLKSI